MKKNIVVLVVACLATSPAKTQTISIEAIKEATKKVLNAIDLKVQRWQTKVIWLQNAQKEIENILSKLKLEEIAGWVEKQRKLYDDYFQELWKVKGIISGYEKVKTVMNLQSRIVTEYKRAFDLLKQDKHFTEAEITYMQKVYGGILEQSISNLDNVLMVAGSFITQMTDEKRLQIIDDASIAMQKNYNDLRIFSHQNMLLSLQRSTDLKDAQTIKQIYGLP